MESWSVENEQLIRATGKQVLSMKGDFSKGDSWNEQQVRYSEYRLSQEVKLTAVSNKIGPDGAESHRLFLQPTHTRSQFPETEHETMTSENI